MVKQFQTYQVLAHFVLRQPLQLLMASLSLLLPAFDSFAFVHRRGPAAQLSYGLMLLLVHLICLWGCPALIPPAWARRRTRPPSAVMLAWLCWELFRMKSPLKGFLVTT